MATITFTDGTGAATLDNSTTGISTGVGSRFADWTPFQRPIGPRVPALGTGRPYQFRFRTDYGASFTMTDIPNTSMATMLRCQEWLLRGEAVTVNTGVPLYNDSYEDTLTNVSPNLHSVGAETSDQR